MRQKVKWLQYMAALLLCIAAVGYVFTHITDNPRYDLILNQRAQLLEAIFATLWISLLTLALSMVFGFLFYLLEMSRIDFIRALARIVKELIMGTPLLVMIFIVVYVVGPMTGVEDKLFLGIGAMTLYTSPYVANSYDAVIKMIDEDQYMVMDFYHFNKYQRYRYIILPQIVRPFIPALVNHLSSCIKSSALLKIVSVSEISYVITVISAKNWAAVEGYLVMWLCYLVITIPLSLLAGYLGRRLEA